MNPGRGAPLERQSRRPAAEPRRVAGVDYASVTAWESDRTRRTARCRGDRLPASGVGGPFPVLHAMRYGVTCIA
jgi:hypothetical protein